jgi:hypothetical protein
VVAGPCRAARFRRSPRAAHDAQAGRPGGVPPGLTLASCAARRRFLALKAGVYFLERVLAEHQRGVALKAGHDLYKQPKRNVGLEIQVSWPYHL